LIGEVVTESTSSNGMGRAIRTRREVMGLARKDLVVDERISLSYQYLTELENGYKQPSAKKLGEIAVVLNTTPLDLMLLGQRIDAGEDPLTAASEMGSVPSQSVVSDGHHGPLRPRGLANDWRPTPTPTGDVARLTEAVLRALEPRLRDLIELEVRRAIDDERGRSR
jgi:transcriptional regulator with XRE-family HTH domain